MIPIQNLHRFGHDALELLADSGPQLGRSILHNCDGQRAILLESTLHIPHHLFSDDLRVTAKTLSIAAFVELLPNAMWSDLFESQDPTDFHS
ncbi:MAG: hypothetical protein GY811_27555 [Myxococcales bacterium]|nr:hypothetical protein [Myxococcales bacterium]